jgi:hypothetical protein
MTELKKELVEKYGEEVKNYAELAADSNSNFAEIKIQLYYRYDYRKYEEYHIEGYWEEIKTEITHSKGKFLTHIQENKEELAEKGSITIIENRIMFILFLPSEPAEIMTIQKREISHRHQISWEDEIIQYHWDGKKLEIKKRKI